MGKCQARFSCVSSAFRAGSARKNAVVGTAQSSELQRLRHRSTALEAETAEDRQALGEHARHDRDATVDIIVNLNRILCFARSHDPSDVLDESPLKRKRKRQKERVERRRIEPLSEITTGRNQYRAIARPCSSKLVKHPRSRFLAHTASKNNRRGSAFLENLDERFKVLGPLGKNETIATAPRRLDHIVTDLCIAGTVFNDRPKDLLDR